MAHRPARPSFGRRGLLLLYLLALAPRLALALAFLDQPIGLDDMFQYDMLARSIAAGHGYRWYGREDVLRHRRYFERYYGFDLDRIQIPERGLPTTFRPPAYPLFLAGVYRLAGEPARLPAARIAQALVGASLAPLAALTARRLRLTSRAALAAGVIVATYPILWMYPLGLASENLYLPLVALNLLALLHAADGPPARRALGAGLIAAAASLTRGSHIVFVALSAVWLARRASPRLAAVMAASALAAILPWMARNSLLLGRPTYVETSIGYNLFVGYHPLGDGSFSTPGALIPLHILDDGQRDRWAFEQAVEFARADPGRIPRLLFNRLAFFFGWEDRELTYFYTNNFFGQIPQPWLALAYGMLVAPWMAVALGAVWGLARAPGGRGRSLVLCLVAAQLLAYLPILAEARFHLPLVSTLAAYAAHAATRPGAASRRPAATVLALAASLGLIALWGWDLAHEWPRLMEMMAEGGHQLYRDY